MNEWQPIETAPKNGTKCVVGAFIKGRGWCMGICWYAPHHGQWLTMSGDMPDGKPTHWLPLPEPPLTSGDRTESAPRSPVVEPSLWDPEAEKAADLARGNPIPHDSEANRKPQTGER